MKNKISMILIALALVGCGANTANEQGEKTPEGTQTGGKEISVVSREDGSGTRSAFVELMGIEEKDGSGNKTDKTTQEAIIANKTDVMLTNVVSDPNAIGYVSLGSLNADVKALKIDGVEATAENVTNGTYKVARPFNIVTTETVSEVAKDFITFILSKDGQAIVEKSGYVGLSDVEEYTSSNQEGKIVIAGSSSVSPVMEKLAEAYQTINTGVTIEIQTSDSSAGVQAALDGNADIGMVSRELKDSETGLKDTKIAMDGIAVIVNKGNAISKATSEQVKNIFIGTTLTWDALEEK